MKIKLLFAFLVSGLFWSQTHAQTLNQPAAWPNTNWTVTGTFNMDPLAFESDPTLTANFAFDDDDAGFASDDSIAAESPVIDLTASGTAGENWITVSAAYVHRYLPFDELVLQYWDADGAVWINWGVPFSSSTPGSPTNDYCAATPVSFTTDVLDVASFTATQLSGFKYRISYDDNPAGADYNYGFCFSSPTITSATPPSCFNPSTLTVSSVTDTAADLAWTENGTATSWNIELVDVTAAGTATGMATASGVGNPYNQTGLVPSNDYEYYVQADCGTDGTSLWVGPFAFTTACGAITAPYTEDFESFDTGINAFSSDNCWTGTGGVYYWKSAPGTDTGSLGTGPDPSITTGNYFYTEASFGIPGDTTDLVSPLVDLTALTAPSLLFDYHMFGGQIGTLDVLVNGTTNVWTLSGQQQTSDTAPWELAVVDLTAYAGQTIRITFRGARANGFEGDIAIDNVVFGELPICIEPAGLTATGIDSSSANLAWTENGTATSWNIELVDITATATATGMATASGVGNPYNQTGLVPSNDYEYYVQADCGTDGTSTWAGPFAFSTTVACPAPTALTVTAISPTSAALGWTAGASETVWDIELVDVTAAATATGMATASGVANPYNQTGLAPANDYEFYVRSDCGAMNGTSIWSGPFAFTTACIAITAPYTEDFESFDTGINAFSSDNCWTGTGGAYYWESAPGTDTASFGTGPDPSITTGNYFYTEATTGNPGDTTDLVSPLVDLTALTAPALLFDYHMFGGQIGTLDVLVNGTTNVWTLSGQQQTSDTAPWELAVVDLTAYAGQMIRITFRGTRVGGFEGDIAIDNVVFGELPSCNNVSGLTVDSFTTDSVTVSWTENSVPADTAWEVVAVAAGDPVPAVGTSNATSIPYVITGLNSSTAYDIYVRGDCSITFVGPVSVTTVAACGDTVYDTGGAAGNYSVNESYTITYLPDTAANVVTLDFTLVDLENCCDTLTIYDGLDTSAPVLEGDLQNPAVFSGFNPAGAITIEFTSDFSITGAGWEANYTCAPRPSCINVSNLTLQSAGPDSLTLSWTENNIPAGTAWEVVAVPAGDPAPVAGTSNATAIPYAITSLTANTSYDVYVRADCSTTFVGPISLTTSCAVFTAYPYTTDFTNNVPNACWEEAGSGEIVDGPMAVGSSDWKAGRSYENFAGTAIPSNLINLYSNTDREWLLSEQYDMTGISNDVLSIEVAVTDYLFTGASDATDTATMGSDDQVDLLITTDAGMTWTSLMTWTAVNQPAVDGTRAFIDLSSYTGTVQFAFFASDGVVDDSEDYDFHVGMFIIDGTAGNEDVFESTLGLYPNPVAGDVVTIRMDGSSASSIEVAVFNTLGQHVMTRSYDQVTNSIQLDNLSSLSKGMYFVKISNGSQEATLKFIKE
jgi:hypothetical protein